AFRAQNQARIDREQREAHDREAAAQAAAEAQAIAAQKSQAEAQLAQQKAQNEALQRQLADAQAAKAQAEAQHAQSQAEQAQMQAQQAQAQAEQAEAARHQMRERLLTQLSQVMETKDTPKGLVVTIPDVLFAVNSSQLKTESRERLARVAGVLLGYPDIHVEVDGYTDSTGSPAYNQKLSQQRADSVLNYLVSQSVPTASITAKGFGQDNPVAPNTTAAGRQQNRRVELVVSGDSIGSVLGEGGGATTPR
ncbi:MAG: OmpA family protein, partial [Acidobacteriales bacterium]|nr:OmpA family protein [Terriglobales bacterium]